MSNGRTEKRGEIILVDAILASVKDEEMTHRALKCNANLETRMVDRQKREANASFP